MTELTNAINSADAATVADLLDALDYSDLEEMDLEELSAALSSAEDLLPGYVPGEPEPEYTAAQDALELAMERVSGMMGEMDLSDYLAD